MPPHIVSLCGPPGSYARDAATLLPSPQCLPAPVPQPPAHNSNLDLAILVANRLVSVVRLDGRLVVLRIAFYAETKGLIED